MVHLHLALLALPVHQTPLAVLVHQTVLSCPDSPAQGQLVTTCRQENNYNYVDVVLLISQGCPSTL